MSGVYPGVDFLSYNMTVSVFDGYMMRAAVVRAERMIDTSQATTYSSANITTDGRRKLWNSWTNIISQVNTAMLQQAASAAKHSILTWNGEVVNKDQLLSKFSIAFGRRFIARVPKQGEEGG